MLKFNRKTEYGLIALRHIASCAADGNVVSAREISDTYKIPYPMMSKVLQQLHKHRVIESVQGIRGGYSIRHSLEDVTLAQVVEIFEGPLGVTDCIGQDLGCILNDSCQVKGLFHNINSRIAAMLNDINLKELTFSSDFNQSV